MRFSFQARKNAPHRQEKTRFPANVPTNWRVVCVLPPVRPHTGQEGFPRLKKLRFKNLRLLVLILALLVLAVAMMIFALSAQKANDSNVLSTAVVNWWLRLTVQGYDQMTEGQQWRLRVQYHTIVRKIAHFFEFALLGTFLFLFLHGLLRLLRRRRPPWLFAVAWLIGALYACTDELHQTFVDGRAGEWRDVLIDSGGVLFGVLVGIGLLRLFHRVKAGEQLDG